MHNGFLGCLTSISAPFRQISDAFKAIFFLGKRSAPFEKSPKWHNRCQDALKDDFSPPFKNGPMPQKKRPISKMPPPKKKSCRPFHVATRITGWWFQTHLKNIRQNGFIFPKLGVKIPKIFELPPPRSSGQEVIKILNLDVMFRPNFG